MVCVCVDASNRVAPILPAAAPCLPLRLVFAMSRVAKQTEASSHARVAPYTRGIMYGMHLAGLPCEEIQKEVAKPDGQQLSLPSVYKSIALSAKHGQMWDGSAEQVSGRGRPRKTSTAMDRKIVALVFAHRGRAFVSTAYVQQKIKATRLLCARTLQRRLVAAGLQWMRRRRKTLAYMIELAMCCYCFVLR